jgi:hypothetical protein
MQELLGQLLTSGTYRSSLPPWCSSRHDADHTRFLGMRKRVGHPRDDGYRHGGCTCFAPAAVFGGSPTKCLLCAELERVRPQVLPGSLQAIRSKRKSAASRQR